MIEQILIGSCEHQRYRRAAQLAMLEHFMYPIEIVEMLFGDGTLIIMIQVSIEIV